MATESNLGVVNGSFGAPHQYNAAELPAHNTPSNIPNNSSANGTNGQVISGNANSDQSASESPSKDEVGWYFVEQYYTTMSKTPEKLHLFYNKKSQFVSGVEDEKVSVSVGQRAISDRIKELAIEDCKVRVTNVDSQESQDKSIVIQVIGEIWMKSNSGRKFVQTFVLAKQSNGYYVLNDIFRYIAEDQDEEEETEAAPATEASVAPESETALHTLPSSDNLAEQEKAVEDVSKLIEKSADEEPTVLATATDADVSVSEAAPSEVAPESEPVVEEPVTEAAVEPEVPKDPEPTPAPPSPQVQESKPAPQEPSAPPKPSAPKTWASMLAGEKAKAAAPVVPVIPAQPKKAPAAVPAQVAATAAAPAEDSQPPASPGGWQTAGQDTGKKQNRQSSNSVSQADNSGKVLGYVKNVTERVTDANLKANLSKYGKLDYFDISRQKNCAFVEFADRAGYEAAVAANPIKVDGEDIYVEERRPRPNAYGGQFNSRGGVRGGRGGVEGRQNSSGGRGGFQKDGGRGNFTPRGGRGNINGRGRGGLTQTA